MNCPHASNVHTPCAASLLAQAIFFKFDLFTKRLNKLIDIFTTIHQFSSLEAHTHIEGLEQMIRALNNIIDDVKRKPYDLLDFYRNQFDRDFLEFNVNIHDLEIQLQVCACVCVLGSFATWVTST
jgi:dynein heavy chain